MWPSPFAFLGIASLSLDFAAAWGNVRPSWHLPHEHRGRPLWNADEPVGPDSISKWATLLHPASDREARLNNRPAEMHEKSNATAALAIEGYWKELHPLLPHLGADDTKKVELALRVAYCAHDGQMRKSGEPYIIHPIAVAGLLAQIKMDTDTIISGLLHDTVEDTELTFLQVELLFGPTVRRIVEGETKVSKLPRIALGNTASGIATPGNSDPNPYLDEQAENLRQMFIAMSEDYRIIVVKLADRLHNMRTLAHMSPEKQQEKSRETLEIFAPLAHRLGIWQFKSELEELAFMYLFPEEFSDLQVLLEGHGAKHRDMLAESKSVLLERLQEDLMLKEQEVEVSVSGRLKELYPLWVKMEARASADGGMKTLSADVVALRVILDVAQRPGEAQEDWKTRGVWLCYHALGLVQHLPESRPVPSQVKDYISFPKPNGYQSLHTSIIRGGQTIEVQIRTSWMHAVAEYGMAAHWLYKDERYGTSSASKVFNKYQVSWLETVKEWDEIHNSTEFLSAIRRELLGKRVFVFLRDGKILNLLRGATIIDAAFAIHTEVGLQMKAAEINGLQKPLSYELVNGDVVSILTDAESRPSLDWMRFSRARSTRAKLRSYFRVQQRATDVQKGWLHLKAFVDLCEPLLLEQYGEAPCADSELREFLVDLGHENVDELCTTLARTQVATLQTTLAQLFNLRMDQVDALAQRHHPINRVQKVPLVLPLKQITESANSFALTPILGTPANMCPCCMPVLGDAPVVGIACTSVEGNAPSKDFVVHRSECSEVLKASVEGCEMVPVQWGAPGLEEYASELQVLCDDRKFLLRDVSDVVSLGSEILRTSSQTINDKAALQFKVKVASSQQLCDLVTAILGVSGVTSCDRIEL